MLNDRHTDKTDSSGEKSQDHQRNGHNPRRFMHVMSNLVVNARSPIECQINQAERIKCRHKSTNSTERPKNWTDCWSVKGVPEDLILTEETREWRYTGQRQSPNHEYRPGYLDLRFKRAHLAHILLARERMD